jgi:Rieske Fe-S protein
MPDPKDSDSTETRARAESRRDFLRLLPLGIFGAMLATVATAAFRFLRPPRAQASSAKWIDVAPLSEVKGAKPVMRTITVERTAGWSSTLEEQFVYVLPQKGNQVVSAVCPHEGCNVNWREEAGVFSCPCHDSNFNADGARLGGPARRGLDPLPSREQNGVIQVQYQTFVNNVAERVTRG